MANEHETTPEFEALLEYVKRSRGFDFTGYKRPSLQRRIVHRMGMVGFKEFADYNDYLEVHPEEFTHLFNTILINVTGFFRDPATWEYLSKELLPDLLRNKREEEPVRLWSTACASGEEVYTIAMLLLELMGLKAFEQRVKIYGTDVDEEALQQARLGSFTEHQMKPVPAPLRDRYFEQQGTRYAFRKEFRRCIIFGRNDLMRDAPISRIDLLACRNVLMYFNSEAQARALQRLHFALNDTGVLLLGKAEMLFTRLNLFVPLDIKRRAFVKVPRSGAVTARDRLMMLAQTGADLGLAPMPHDGRGGHAIVDNMRLRQAAFATDPVASLIFDHDGTLVIASDQARLLFRLGEQDIGRPLQDLELSYRPIELRTHIEQAVATRKAIDIQDVQWPGPAGELRHFEVRVIPLVDASDTLLGVKASFLDLTRYKRLQEELQQSHHELETAYEELQTTNEERETTNEELQSTNEELETTNEEVQSSNEELETMNEELQSTNEELEATNDQLRERSDELLHSNAFLHSILNSMNLPVAVIDKEMRVWAWNEHAQDMWGLRASDAIGQHFLTLDVGLPVERLRQPLKAALAGERGDGVHIIPAINRRGRQLQCAVKCVPVQADGNGVAGVILMMQEHQEPTT